MMLKKTMLIHHMYLYIYWTFICIFKDHNLSIQYIYIFKFIYTWSLINIFCIIQSFLIDLKCFIIIKINYIYGSKKD